MGMRAILLWTALTTLIGGPLAAQITVKDRIRRELDEKQRLMREGKVVLTNVRATVRLQNGSRLRGVVRQGRFVERVAGLDFVPSERSAPGAGIRLWYYDQTNSYVFLPFESIREYRIGEKLTDDQVRAMAEEFERRQREAAERAARGAKPGEDGGDAGGQGQGPPQNLPPGVQPEAVKGPGGKPGYIAGLTPEQNALLKEFPPDEGWGPDRLREIEARKIRIGVYPNEAERKFIANYDQWNEANDLRRKLAQEQPTPSETPPAPPGGGGGQVEPKPEPTPGSTPGSSSGSKRR